MQLIIMAKCGVPIFSIASLGSFILALGEVGSSKHVFLQLNLMMSSHSEFVVIGVHNLHLRYPNTFVLCLHGYT